MTSEEARGERRRDRVPHRQRVPQPSPLRVADEENRPAHRAIRAAGEDHVAFGSDFDGGPMPARHMRDIRDLAMITDAMLRQGYSKDRIGKFLGGNLRRVFREVTGNAQ